MSGKGPGLYYIEDGGAVFPGKDQVYPAIFNTFHKNSAKRFPKSDLRTGLQALTLPRLRRSVAQGALNINSRAGFLKRYRLLLIL